jgi:hypothetical protein
MYSNPKPFWDKGAKLDEYGVNAVFVHGGSITADLMARAKAEGARVFAEFATLNGKGYVEKHPEAWPVNEKGEKAPAATWFLGACPTEPGFRAYRMKQLEDLLDRFDVAGVWMDYFHWHAQFEEPEPILPETCFSQTCLEGFRQATGVHATPAEILARHDRQWRQWRVEQLLNWAREMKAVLNRKRPGALLGVYHCPWTDEEYGGARTRVLGLDYKALDRIVDVFSPMVYHGRMGRKPEWVADYVGWMSGAVEGKIWPIVQVHGDAAEFETVLRGGTYGRASGVMMFTAKAVSDDSEKMAAMRRLYLGWAGQ